MTIAFWCVIAAGVLPVVAISFAKWGLQGYDNENPREWLGRQTGYRARAAAAERNMFESFPFFAAAVLIAHVVAGPHSAVDTMAVVYLLLRIGYLAAYLTNKATLRSLIWTVAYLLTLAIASAGAWLG